MLFFFGLFLSACRLHKVKLHEVKFMFSTPSQAPRAGKGEGGGVG